MIVETSRFGKIEIEEEDIITFVSPILGFTRFTRFVLLKHREDIPYIMWLQSVEEPSLAFAVVDPFFVVDEINYEVEIPDEDVKELGIKSPTDIAIFTLISIPDGPESISINLKAPIVINTKTRKGKQIIVDKDYPLRYPLVKSKRSERSAV